MVVLVLFSKNPMLSRLIVKSSMMIAVEGPYRSWSIVALLKWILVYVTRFL